MLAFIFKAVGIILIVFLVLCIGNLYKVFEKLPVKGNDRGWVAFGLLAEIIIIIELAIKIITG